MSIGQAMQAAREQGGLTITQVSQQTRIRETIIRGIEHDDFSACGGDFYARGHIRAIARVILFSGTDRGCSRVLTAWTRERFWMFMGTDRTTSPG